VDSLDTVIAGLSCRQVLHHLNDFLDGDLPLADVSRVTAHLAECHTCERFGGRVGALVAALHGSTVTEAPLSPAAAERLQARLVSARR